jgi:hypothetical protein
MLVCAAIQSTVAIFRSEIVAAHVAMHRLRAIHPKSDRLNGGEMIRLVFFRRTR